MELSDFLSDEHNANWKFLDGVQDLCSEALFPECSFTRNVGECAERIINFDYSCEVRLKTDFILKKP
jgi:hypothetical protein